jgi:hypothetical protein
MRILSKRGECWKADADNRSCGDLVRSCLNVSEINKVGKRCTLEVRWYSGRCDQGLDFGYLLSICVDTLIGVYQRASFIVYCDYNASEREPRIRNFLAIGSNMSFALSTFSSVTYSGATVNLSSQLFTYLESLDFVALIWVTVNRTLETHSHNQHQAHSS